MLHHMFRLASSFINSFWFHQHFFLFFLFFLVLFSCVAKCLVLLMHTNSAPGSKGQAHLGDHGFRSRFCLWPYVYTPCTLTVVYTPHPAWSSHSWHSQTFTAYLREGFVCMCVCVCVCDCLCLSLFKLPHIQIHTFYKCGKLICVRNGCKTSLYGNMNSFTVHP